jgi:6-phosphogluconolactonase
MQKRTLHIYPDAEAASRAAARQVADAVRQAVAERGQFALVLSGGNTPRRLYELLAAPPLRDEVDWPKVLFFWGDERPVPPDHPQSNYRMAREALLGPLGIREGQVRRMKGEAVNLAAAALDYQNDISQALGNPAHGEPPAFDLVLLGMGADGHTASLFPATPALTETRQWVAANRVLKLDCTRLTMTPMLLNRARQVQFLVTGADKADALAEVLEGPLDVVRLPAQIIRPSAGKVDWFLDAAAAGKLKRA